jgi:hypothetical protein
MKTAKCLVSRIAIVYIESASPKWDCSGRNSGNLGDYEVKFIAVLKMLKAKYDLEAAVLVILICNRTKIGKIKYVPLHR